MSTVILAKVERIELSRTVLETAALPLSYTNIGGVGKNRTFSSGLWDPSQHQAATPNWRRWRESNSHARCWPPQLYHWATPTLEVWVRFELTTLRICNPFPWATRAPHRIKKPSKIFIWEGSLIRYIFDIRYIEPPHMRIYSPQSGVINQFCVCLCESFICNRVPLFVLLLYSTLLL